MPRPLPRRCTRRAVEALESRRLLDASYHALAAGPFAQDWSNLAQIAAVDDWSGVPSILGYQGDGLVLVAGTDPRALTTGATGAVKLAPNETDPATSTAAGVARFTLDNATVALKGSGTAAAPALVLHLDTTGTADAKVRFDLRDIDASTNNTTQPFVVQYRVGDSGPFANVAASFLDDASRGPGLADLVTRVVAPLPADAANRPRVQVRILTANAPSTDEWIGVDNIVATATPAAAGGSFGLAVAEVRAGEADPSVTVRVVRVGGSSGPATVTLGPLDTSATPGVDYDPPAIFDNTERRVTFADGETARDLVIPLRDDDVLDGRKTLVVTLTGVTDSTDGAALGLNASATITIVDDESAAARLNEVEVNPDGSADNPFEYVEVRGLPNAPTSGLYYVAVNGDASTSTPAVLGATNFVQGLDETIFNTRFGSSGLLVVKASAGGHPAAPGTPALPNRYLEEQPNLSNNTVTHLLIFSRDPIYAGSDLDTNDDGVLDLPAGAVLVDSVGWSDGGAADRVYSPAVLTQPSGTPDAASRFPHDLRASTAAAWYSGDLAGATPANPAGLLYDASKASANLPAGGALTPFLANFGDGGANAAPTAIDVEYIVPRTGEFRVGPDDGLLAGASDPDGDPIAALGGEISLANGFFTPRPDGSFTYVPPVGFASQRTFVYFVSDGRSDTPERIVTFRAAAAPNLPPTLTAPEGGIALDEDSSVTLGGAGRLVLGDPDLDGGMLKVWLFTSEGVLTLSGTAGLTITLGDGQAERLIEFTGTLAAVNAALDGLIFAPFADFDGPATLFVRADDLGNNGTGGPRVLETTVAIQVRPVADDPPAARPDSASATEDTPLVLDVLANDSDPDGDALTPEIVADPLRGTAVVNPDRTITYTPAADYADPAGDSFTYRAVDPGGLKSEAVTVTIGVTPVNDGPVFDPVGPLSVDEGSTVRFRVRATDPDGPQDAIRYRSVSDTFPGLSVDPITGEVAYVAPDGPGTARPIIVATDPGRAAQIEVPILIRNVNPAVAPIAAAALFAGGVLDRAGSFADPGAETWTATVDYGDGSGVRPLALSGKTFTLNHAYAAPGSYTAVVTVTDGSGRGEARFAVAVADAAPPPVTVALGRAAVRGRAIRNFTLKLSAPAANPRAARYRLVLAGRDATFGTRDDRAIALRPAAYDAARNAITLTPRRRLALAATPVLLTASGLVDALGRPIDGDKDGQPGGEYAALFRRRSLITFAARGGGR